MVTPGGGVPGRFDNLLILHGHCRDGIVDATFALLDGTR